MRRITRPSRRVLLIVVAALAVVLTTEAVVLAASKLRNGGAIMAVKTVTDDAEFSHTSQTFANIPGMSTTVAIPEGETGLLLITFSAETKCIDEFGEPTAACLLRVLIGGQPANPVEVIFDGALDGNAWETNSMQFVLVKPAANWPVRVQIAVDSAESTFSLGKRTLTVLHSKV